MRYISSQYVFTNAGPPLKRPVICTDDDGTVISIEQTSGELNERHSVEFYNGIIVPGFVNCHCHLELSWMKGKIPERTGLGGFLSNVTSLRSNQQDDVNDPVRNADNSMSSEGVVLCADICNTPLTFGIKKRSKIKYINLLEVYGIDSAKAQKRIDEVLELAGFAQDEGLTWQIVPHSAYSVSVPLFRLIRENSSSNFLSSIHFMETDDEKLLLSEQKGALMEAYKKILSPSSEVKSVINHSTAILEEITRSGSLLLVHNTFISKEIIDELKTRDNLFYCLCPGSNLYISGSLPPVSLMKEEDCNIVIGTDSLASNRALSIIGELKIIQDNFPGISLEELVKWATLNGAIALGEETKYGSIEPGKKPGIVLIENAGLKDLRLLDTTSARRII